MAALTDWLDNPALTVYVNGDDTLVRYFLKAASVATDITPVNIYGVQEVSPDAVKYGIEEEIYHSGGGRTKIKRRPEFTVNIPIFASRVDTFVGAIHSQVFGSSSSYYANVLTFDDVPRINLEIVYRLPDMTHVGSLVLCNLIPQDFTPGSKTGNQIVQVPFYSRFIPVKLAAGARCVLDKFNGDGSITTFTLSQTPLNLMDMNVGLKDEFVLDNVIYVETKSSTATVGTLVKKDITIVGTTLTFSTAPAAGTTVEVFYACAA